MTATTATTATATTETTETTEILPFREARRRDRSIRDEAWLCDLLHRTPVGVLSLAGDPWPKAVPNLFVFDEERLCVFLHAARQGETRELIDRRPKVSFCVAHMGRLLPAESAVNFSVEYSSVVLEGHAGVVGDPAEAARALDLLMRKYAGHLEPGRDYRRIEDKDLARTSVFRVDIERWSGKGKVSDAADAYEYPPMPVAACPVPRPQEGT